MTDDENRRPQNASQQLDLLAIEFPTDRLTIRSIRELMSDKLGSSDVMSDLDAVMSVEQELAEVMFQAATQVDSTPEQASRSLESQDELISLLGLDYQRFGLSAGDHQTAEFIRKIKSQVSNQAILDRGKTD